LYCNSTFQVVLDATVLWLRLHHIAYYVLYSFVQNSLKKTFEKKWPLRIKIDKVLTHFAFSSLFSSRPHGPQGKQEAAQPSPINAGVVIAESSQLFFSTTLRAAESFDPRNVPEGSLHRGWGTAKMVHCFIKHIVVSSRQIF
jgi:hypothetical protein